MWLFRIYADMYASLSPQVSWFVHMNGEIWKQNADELCLDFDAILKQDHFK
jgi:hypothetical protein